MGTSPTDSSGALSLLSPVVSQAQSSINYEPNNSVPAATNSPTFRHPLPPSLARPTRLPLQQGQMIIRGQRMPQFSDPRMQVCIVFLLVRMFLHTEHFKIIYTVGDLFSIEIKQMYLENVSTFNPRTGAL